MAKVHFFTELWELFIVIHERIFENTVSIETGGGLDQRFLRGNSLLFCLRRWCQKELDLLVGWEVFGILVILTSLP